MEESRSSVSPSPWPYLFFTGDGNDENSNQLICTIPPSLPSSSSSCSRDISYQYVSMPELCGKVVRSCCSGWLVLSTDYFTDDYCLFNPVSLQSIHLPRLKKKKKNKKKSSKQLPETTLHHVLSSPPNDSNSLFLLFKKRCILFCRLRDKVKRWCRVSYFKHHIDDWICWPVYCNGKIYGATCERKQLVCIEINKPKSDGIAITLMDYCQIPHCSWKLANFLGDTYLAESCGELFAIYVMHRNAEYHKFLYINVFKLDFSKMIWKAVESARDRAFFVERHTESCVSCPYPRDYQGEGSYIHYRNFMAGVYSFYSYNIEDKSIHLSLACPELPIPTRASTWLLTERNRIWDELLGETKIVNGTPEEEEQSLKKRSAIVATSADTEKTLEKGLSELPIDVLQVIGNHLPVVDYLNFRSTCLSSKLATPLRSTYTSLTPWLMLTDKDKSLMTFIEPTGGNRYLLNIPKEVGDARVCYSNHGWLLLLNDEDIEASFFFLNPFTKAIIRLPDLTVDYEIHVSNIVESFGFSSPPTSADCRVVGFSFSNFPHQIFITSPRDEEWIIIDINPHISHSPCESRPVFYRGNFCVLCDGLKLGVLKMGQADFSWEILAADPPIIGDSHNTFSYLMEYCNDLVAVFVTPHGQEVEVFKLDNSTLVWEKVENLGKHMIFICDWTSFSAIAEVPRMENKIYFPRLCGDDIIFYSLDDCMIQTYGSIGKEEKALIDFYGTKEYILYPCWIQPSW